MKIIKSKISTNKHIASKWNPYRENRERKKSSSIVSVCHLVLQRITSRLPSIYLRGLSEFTLRFELWNNTIKFFHSILFIPCSHFILVIYSSLSFAIWILFLFQTNFILTQRVSDSINMLNAQIAKSESK